MSIEKLTKVSTIQSSDLIALFSASLGGDAATTLGTLLTWLQSQLTATSGPVTQYAAPSATGFTVTVVPALDGADTWLLLTPVAGYAAGTITLPPLAQCVHGQELIVSSTQAVTTLTVSGNGASVNGAPTTLAANAFFRLRFDGVFDAWYRIG